MGNDLGIRELEVLRVLQQDCDKAQKTLAYEAGLGEVMFSKLRSQLKARGVIKRTAVVLDPAKLGLGSLCFFTVECAPGKRNAVLDILRGYSEVQEVHILDGTMPLFVKARTQTNTEMSTLRGKILDIEGVRDITARISMHTAKETLDLPI